MKEGALHYTNARMIFGKGCPSLACTDSENYHMREVKAQI